MCGRYFASFVLPNQGQGIQNSAILRVYWQKFEENSVLMSTETRLQTSLGPRIKSSSEECSADLGSTKMIYELLIRASGQQTPSADNLVWIESDLPTRSFEQWMTERSLLTRMSSAPVVRWGVVQSARKAHFKLATEAQALEHHISELINGSHEVHAVPDASRALKAFQLRPAALVELC